MKRHKDIDIFLKELKKYGEDNNIPNITERNAFYLGKLMQERKIQSLLEIGTANGYSSIYFANTISPHGGKITTIEFSQLAYEMAGENIEQSGLSEHIIQYYGDAREIIPYLTESYDMIFIDGLKKATLDFFLLARKKLKSWGIIIIDDVMKFRHKMEDLYSYLEKQSIPYRLEKIDDDDGIMILENL